MTAASPPLSLRYLGGCPGRDRPGPVTVVVLDDRFEVQGHGWGWRIGFGSVVRVDEPQPAPDGDGLVVPIVWTPPQGERTLMLSGRDAVRLRFLLAQAVAAGRFAAARAAVSHIETPPPTRRPGGRPMPGPWQRELRRMRAVTTAALVTALAALVLVFGAAIVVVGRGAGGGHWARDRAVIAARASDVRLAGDRNDAGALSTALQALVDECHRLEAYNGDAANTGDDFVEVQRTCAGAGVALF